MASSNGEELEEEEEEEGEIITEEEEEEEKEEEKGKELEEELEEEEEKEEEEEENNTDWIQVVKGPRKRKGTSSEIDSIPTSKKKKRKRLVCYVTNDDPGETTAPPLLNPSRTLTKNQKGLLRYLSDIATHSSKSSKYRKPPNIDFKTAEFQAVLRHILCGDPGVVGKRGKPVHVDVLCKSKVVIIWLSCVSRNDYTESSDETFSGLKSLIRGHFNITHPGSDRFAHFGLESFMEIDETVKMTPKESQSTSDDTVTDNFTRQNCILTHQQLIENEFPLPPLSPLSTYHPPSPPHPPPSPCALSNFIPPSPTNPPSPTFTPSISPPPPSSPPPSRSPSPSLPNPQTEPPIIQTSYITLGPWPTDIADSLIHDPSISTYPLFSIDCEMVQTTAGSELARISIIDESMSCVYTSLVKPDNPVVDYLTRFSGVSEDMLLPVQVTLKDVQAKLVELLPPKCILVGHSLENDLIALKLHHPYIIDTSLLFAPTATPRSKPSLKAVVKKLLNKDIQSSMAGHDPTEDAQACMELVKKKLAEGPMCVIQWGQHKRWLPVYLSSCGVSTKVIDKQSLACLYTDRSANGLSVSSDEEASSTAINEIPNSRFVFTQFHWLENLRRKEGEVKSDKLASTFSSLDKYACDIVNSCPQGTLALVVCGSSYIKEVRELQRDPNATNKELKDAVKKARNGIVLVAWK